MADNRQYYVNLIGEEEHPTSVNEDLMEGSFVKYLEHYNQEGSDFIGVTLDALSNLFGLDIELYADECIPFYV
jgi:hypothetical protein